jgi:DNA 3'-phosphatase
VILSSFVSRRPHPRHFLSMSSPPPRPTKRTKTTGQASLTAFFGSRPPTAAAAAAASEKKHPQKNHDGVVGEEGSPVAQKGPDGDPGSESSSSLQEKKKEDASSSLDPIVPRMVRWSESRWHLYKDCVIYRRDGDNVVASGSSGGRTKVAAFDLDGTLLTWRTPAGGWPSALSDYELWNGSVIAKLRQLYDNEHYQLIIISNQGGIRKALKGKIATKVKNLIEWLIATIDRPVSVIMSTSKNSGYHKPSVELWDLAQRLFCHTNHSNEPSWNVAESFYVGDSVITAGDPQGGVDETLARNVSDKYQVTLAFHTPTDFFGPSTSELRNRQESTNLMGDDTAPPATMLEERARWHSGDIHGQRPILLLLCGAQGSGKSTFAQRLSSDTYQHISQDTIKNGQAGTRSQVEAAVRAALSSSSSSFSTPSSPPRSVVLDRMHLDAAQRAIFIDIARDCGNVPVHTLTFDLPAAVSAQRVLARRDHLVTGESGARLAQQSAGRLVRPRWDEGIVLCHTITHPGMVDRFVNLYNGKIEIPTHFPIVAAAGADHKILRMPSVILGTMGLGRRIAAETVAHALDLGIAGIDTAPTYKNEDLVLPNSNNDNNNDVFCIVKVPKRAMTAADVASELDASLAKLRRDRADLLLMHWPAATNETTRTLWTAMEAAARVGKAKALGVCNFNVAALSHLLSFCAIRPSVVQVERHPRLAQWDLVDFCCQHDIQLQAHTPLGQGLIVEDEIVRGIAKKYSSENNVVVSPAQVALAWNLQQGVAVVPKCATRAHQQELKTIVPLSSDDLMTLNDLSNTNPQRFVAPPFMYGSADFCWAARFPKPTTK